MRVSCATSCLREHALADALHEIANAGYAAAEVSAAQVEATFGRGEDAARGLVELLARHDLTLSSMTAAPLAAASAEDMAADTQSVCRHVRLARRLGLASVNVHAGDRKTQGFDTLIGALREVASYAARLGMQINLANRRDSRIEQSEDVRCALSRLAGETVRITVDCGEFHDAAVNPVHAFREFPGRIGLVYVADRIGKRPVRIGQGETNIAAIVEMAHRSGYDGWLVVRDELPEDEAATAFLSDARAFLGQFAGRLA